jgi:hypothetical protein
LHKIEVVQRSKYAFLKYFVTFHGAGWVFDTFCYGDEDFVKFGGTKFFGNAVGRQEIAAVRDGGSRCG